MTQKPEMIDIKAAHQRLLALRAELNALADTRTASTATVELDQTRVGRLSRMDALQQQAMAKATTERTHLNLLRIESALRRCEDGSYGECLRCAELINPRRLEIDPTATLCIECASA